MDFEEIMAKCGDRHRYQYMLLALYGFVMFATCRHSFSQNIISFATDHWCHHEQLENRSFAEIEAIYSKFEKPSCTRLATIEGENVTVSSERCDRWIYHHDHGFRSMNAELNWVCDNAYKPRVGQSFFFVGSLCGILFFGELGDRIGRIRTLILANWFGFVGDFMSIFMKTVNGFAVSRFLSGFSFPANNSMMYILVLEYISPSLRNVGLNTVLTASKCLAIISIPMQAMQLGQWRLVLAWTSFPLLLVTFFYFFVEESAQWLITRNDVDGAIRRLKRVAKFNRREVSEEDFESFRKHCMSLKSNQTKLSDALKTPRLRKNLIIAMIVYTLIALCLSTMLINVEGLGISPLIMFALTGLTLIPTSLISAFVQDRTGPKLMGVSSMLVTAFITLTCGLLLSLWKQANVVGLVSLMLIARGSQAVTRISSVVFINELSPTCVRSRSLGAANALAGAASVLTPYLIHLNTYFQGASSFVLSLLFVVSAWLSLYLPDTRNAKLPMTLEEGEQVGRGESMFDFLRSSQRATDLEPQQKLMSK